MEIYSIGVANKSVQTEPVTCVFQARSSQEFAAECGDGVKSMVAPAAQFLTLHSQSFQSPTTMTLQFTPVGHGPADLCR